jgi:hypothetical protein
MENQNIPDETPNQQLPEGHKNARKRGSSLLAATIARSATAQVRRHSGAGLASTGTNISYEGATAPGAGGSVGTGFSSGQEATGETIHTNSDYEQNRGGRPSKRKNREDDASETDNLEEQCGPVK